MVVDIDLFKKITIFIKQIKKTQMKNLHILHDVLGIIGSSYFWSDG